MISAFIKIRFKQIIRATNGLGLFRIVFLSGMLGFFAYGLFILTAEPPDLFYASGVYLMTILFIHVKRSDKTFLKIHFRNYKLIIFSEYLLLILPLFIGLSYHKQWISFLSVITLTLLIVNIKFKPGQKSFNTALQALIPSDCFEWKGGVRKTLILMVALWLIGLGTSFFIGSIPVVIFILGILPLSFYEKNEPLQMILAYEMGAGRFLMHKIKMQFIIFSILSIPLIIAFLIFHHEKWYIPIAEFLIFITIHIYIIFTKYAFYQPNNRFTGTQVFGLIGVMGMVIPVFIPVVWLLSIRFYFKSRENLNFYLNDYN
jgi:hypothetical protein